MWTYSHFPCPHVGPPFCVDTVNTRFEINRKACCFSVARRGTVNASAAYHFKTCNSLQSMNEIIYLQEAWHWAYFFF